MPGPPKLNEPAADANHLFPVFLKLEQLSVLVIGGGNIGHEKLQALLGNSPATSVRLIAISISDKVRELAAKYENVVLVQKEYSPEDLAQADLLIVAVNDIPLCERIKQDASAQGILVNVADTPLLCDFYLGSIVSKGHLKIAISTNGKSPTIAKRLKEVLGETIPDEMDSVLNNMHHIRESIQGDFSEKVKQLDGLTRVLVAKQHSFEVDNLGKAKAKKWQRVLKWCLFAFVFMILGALVFRLLFPGG